MDEFMGGTGANAVSVLWLASAHEPALWIKAAYRLEQRLSFIDRYLV